MNSLRIAVVGATGAVGGVLLEVIAERGLPVDQIRLCASERSWGRKLAFQGRDIEVEPVTQELLSQVDVVFIAAGSGISRQVAPIAVDQGAFVIDKSSAFRMDPDVPLVVPEVNGDDLADHRGIVSTPNCSTTQFVMALKPLDDANPIARAIVDTYQSVSGTGAAAMDELRLQSGQVLNGGVAEPDQYPHRIAFNVLPQVETFLDNGYTTEEMKMVEETRKIMHRPDLPVSATCARVPVMVSHSEAVHVEFERPMSPGQVSEILSDAPGVEVVDEPGEAVYPMPIDAEGRDPVYVGRIRRDVSHPNGIAMWLVSDNLRKGAALNAVQIAEQVLDGDLLNPATTRHSREGGNPSHTRHSRASFRHSREDGNPSPTRHSRASFRHSREDGNPSHTRHSHASFRHSREDGNPSRPTRKTGHW